MAGLALPSRPQQKKKNPIEDMYKLYNTSVEKQAGDYDDIMKRFRGIYDNPFGDDGSGGSNFNFSFSPYTPETSTYRRSADTTAALGELRNLSETGGLSSADQQNLRARGTSPIRSMYANAKRDMDRRRSIAGGYSPNYNATTARMTRDMSSGVADQLDKVNAGIAEMVQSGRLSAAPNYASAAQAESELSSRYDFENMNAKNEAKRFNASSLMQLYGDKRADRNTANSNRLAAAQGMTGLYGTTPALSRLYGDQAMDTAKFQNDVNQQKKRTATSLLTGLRRN